VDDLNRPDITIADYSGGGEEGWAMERYSKAQLRGVIRWGGADRRGRTSCALQYAR
jgi:polar amino acid transport system substrate-binding protein